MKMNHKMKTTFPASHLTAEHPVVDAGGLVSAHGAHAAPAPALDFFFLHVGCVCSESVKMQEVLSLAALIKNQLGTDSC